MDFLPWQVKNAEHIYIHIPFCIKKCPYCDFVSVALAEADAAVSSYFDALFMEIEQKLSQEDRTTIQTIYFGGGTPTAVDAKYLVEALAVIKKHKELDPNYEISVEMNPGTYDANNLRLLKAAGVNRLSIGLQSSQDKFLKLLGRVHDLQDFLHSFEEARRLGFDNISVDLMLALPHQTLAELEKDIDFVLAIQPEHLSVYSLIIEDATPFGKKYKEGFSPLPSDILERQMYHLVKNKLEASDYEHYEISNFSKSGFRSRHNSSYWLGKSYHGFGLGAASYINGARYINPSEFATYFKAVKQGNPGILEEVINQVEAIKEFFIFRLRMLEGVSNTDFKKLFDQDIPLKYLDILKHHEDLGYIEKDKESFKLSEKGLDYADFVSRDFI